MARPTYPLLTQRLALRPFVDRDLEAVYDIDSREDVARYLYTGPRTRDEVREALAIRAGMTSMSDEGDAIRLAVIREDTGALIGDVSLRYMSREHSQGEIGFVFHPDHHGHGYATEASLVMLRIGFEEVGLHRIVGRCEARNTASAPCHGAPRHET